MKARPARIMLLGGYGQTNLGDDLLLRNFHSLLLAAVTQTPFVGISYDVKCTRFLAESGYDHWVELEGLTADGLVSVLDTLAATRASGTGALAEAVRPRFTQARADLAAAIPAFAHSPG